MRVYEESAEKTVEAMAQNTLYVVSTRTGRPLWTSQQRHAAGSGVNSIQVPVLAGILQTISALYDAEDDIDAGARVHSSQRDSLREVGLLSGRFRALFRHLDGKLLFVAIAAVPGDSTARCVPPAASSRHIVERTLELIRRHTVFVLTETQITRILAREPGFDLSALLVGTERHYDRIVAATHSEPLLKVDSETTKESTAGRANKDGGSGNVTVDIPGLEGSSTMPNGSNTQHDEEYEEVDDDNDEEEEDTIPKNINVAQSIPILSGSVPTMQLPRRLRDALSSVLAAMDIKPDPTLVHEDTTSEFTYAGQTLTRKELEYEKSLVYTMLVSTDGRLVATYNGSGVVAAGRCSAHIDSRNNNNRGRDNSHSRSSTVNSKKSISPSRILGTMSGNEPFLSLKEAERASTSAETVADTLTTCADPISAEDYHILTNFILADIPSVSVEGTNDSTTIKSLQSQNWLPCCLQDLDKSRFVYAHYTFLDCLSKGKDQEIYGEKDVPNVEFENDSAHNSNRNSSTGDNHFEDDDDEDDDDENDEILRLARETTILTEEQTTVKTQSADNKIFKKRKLSKKCVTPKLCLIQVTRSKDSFYHMSRRFEHITSTFETMEKHGVLQPLNALLEKRLNSPFDHPYLSISLNEIFKEEMIPGIRHFAFFRQPNHALGCPCQISHISNLENTAHMNYFADTTSAILCSRNTENFKRKGEEYMLAQEHKTLANASTWIKNRTRSQKKRSSLINSKRKQLQQSTKSKNNLDNYLIFGSHESKIVLEEDNSPLHRLHGCRCPCPHCRSNTPAESGLASTVSGSRAASRMIAIHTATPLPYAAIDMCEEGLSVPEMLTPTNQDTKDISIFRKTIDNDELTNNYKTVEFDISESNGPSVLQNELMKQLYKHRAIKQNQSGTNRFIKFDPNSELKDYLDRGTTSKVNKTINIDFKRDDPLNSIPKCSHDSQFMNEFNRLRCIGSTGRSIFESMEQIGSKSKISTDVLPVFSYFFNNNFNKGIKEVRTSYRTRYTEQYSSISVEDQKRKQLNQIRMLDRIFTESIDSALQLVRTVVTTGSSSTAIERLSSPYFGWNTRFENLTLHKTVKISKLDILSISRKCDKILLELTPKTNENSDVYLGIMSGLPTEYKLPLEYLAVDLDESLDLSSQPKTNQTSTPSSHIHNVIYLMKWFLSGFGQVRPGYSKFVASLRNDDNKDSVNSTDYNISSQKELVKGLGTGNQIQQQATKDLATLNPVVLLPLAPPLLCPCSKVTNEVIISDVIRPFGIADIDSNMHSDTAQFDSLIQEGRKNEIENEEKSSHYTQYRNKFRLDMYTAAMKLVSDVPTGSLLLKNAVGTTKILSLDEENEPIIKAQNTNDNNGTTLSNWNLQDLTNALVNKDKSQERGTLHVPTGNSSALATSRSATGTLFGTSYNNNSTQKGSELDDHVQPRVSTTATDSTFDDGDVISHDDKASNDEFRNQNIRRRNPRGEDLTNFSPEGGSSDDILDNNMKTDYEGYKEESNSKQSTRRDGEEIGPSNSSYDEYDGRQIDDADDDDRSTNFSASMSISHKGANYNTLGRHTTTYVKSPTRDGTTGIINTSENGFSKTDDDLPVSASTIVNGSKLDMMEDSKIKNSQISKTILDSSVNSNFSSMNSISNYLPQSIRSRTYKAASSSDNDLIGSQNGSTLELESKENNVAVDPCTFTCKPNPDKHDYYDLYFEPTSTTFPKTIFSENIGAINANGLEPPSVNNRSESMNAQGGNNNDSTPIDSSTLNAIPLTANGSNVSGWETGSAVNRRRYLSETDSTRPLLSHQNSRSGTIKSRTKLMDLNLCQTNALDLNYRDYPVGDVIDSKGNVIDSVEENSVSHGTNASKMTTQSVANLVDPCVVVASKSETVVAVRTPVGVLVVGLSPRTTLDHAKSISTRLLNWIQRNEQDLFIC